MKEKTPPPLPPGSEATIAFEHTPPPVSKSKVDSLLPPGADEPAPPPMSHAEATVQLPQGIPAGVGKVAAEIKLAPAIVAMRKQTSSADEKAERRLWKNLILFGLSIVVLTIVFYWLAR